MTGCGGWCLELRRGGRYEEDDKSGSDLLKNESDICRNAGGSLFERGGTATYGYGAIGKFE